MASIVQVERTQEGLTCCADRQHAAHYTLRCWVTTWPQICDRLGADARRGVTLEGLQRRYSCVDGAGTRLLRAHLQLLQRQAAAERVHAALVTTEHDPLHWLAVCGWS